MTRIPWVEAKRESKRNLDQTGSNTTEENELLEVAKSRFEASRTAKVDPNGRMLHSKWRDMDRLYQNDHWWGHVPAHKSKPVLNFAFGFIESVVSRMTDSNPRISVYPRRSNRDHKLSQLLQHHQNYLWYHNKMQTRFTSGVRSCLKYGSSIYKAVWDPDEYDGMGEVVYRQISPFNFYNDPRAYEMEDMEFCFQTALKPIEYLIRRWPDKAPLIMPGVQDYDDSESNQINTGAGEESGLVTEYHFRDEEGRTCVMYYSQNVVLDIIGGDYDGSGKPVYEHNRFPFSKADDYPLEKHFWGMGEMEIIEMVQKLINTFEAQIIDNTRLMSNSQWHVNKSLSGLTEDDAAIFNDMPGAVVFSANGGIERFSGAAIPPHIPQHITFLIHAAEQILGVHDVVQGRRPEGVRASSAIIALQEAANIRVRQKTRQMDIALAELADQGNWLMLEHYDEPRHVRMTGQSEIMTLDVREALESRMVDRAVMAELQEAGVRPEDLAPEEMDQIFQEVKFPEFDVEVSIGPATPYSQAMMSERALEFFDRGVIDHQALLEMTNFPNWEEVLSRMGGGPPNEEGGERIGESTFRGGAAGRPMRGGDD